MSDYSELDFLIKAAAAEEHVYAVNRAALEKAKRDTELSEQRASDAWRAAEAWTRDRISEAAGHKPHPLTEEHP